MGSPGVPRPTRWPAIGLWMAVGLGGELVGVEMVIQDDNQEKKPKALQKKEVRYFTE